MSTLPDFAKSRQAEARVEDIYATRSFVLSETWRGWALEGLSFKQPILPGVNSAQCAIHPKHDAPVVNCKCGFYCYDEEAGKLWPQLYGGPASSGTRYSIDGIVRVSGRLVVHNSGLRAQNLEVVAFVTTSHEAREKLNELFPSAPVFKSLEAAMLEYPVTKLNRDEATEAQEGSLLEYFASAASASLLIAAFALAAFAAFVFDLHSINNAPLVVSFTASSLAGGGAIVGGVWLNRFCGRGIMVVSKTLMSCGYLMFFGHLSLAALTVFASSDAELLIASLIMRLWLALVVNLIMAAGIVLSFAQRGNLARRPSAFEFGALLQGEDHD